MDVFIPSGEEAVFDPFREDCVEDPALRGVHMDLLFRLQFLRQGRKRKKETTAGAQSSRLSDAP